MMYRALDKWLKRIKQVIKTEFNRLGVMGFDELNVVHTSQLTEQVYEHLRNQNLEMFIKLYRQRYKRATGMEPLINNAERVLTDYNPVTGYLYYNEAERKMLRLNEQILTAREYDNRTGMNAALLTAANGWYRQTAQYGIDVVDRGTIDGYKDMGIKFVEWVAELDDKTCEECKGLDGQKFPIDKIPAKPHYNCRCYVIPVKEKE